jgi:uncharacterized membrane protein YccC
VSEASAGAVAGPGLAAEPGLGARLRADLVPFPGRWRDAAVAGLAPALASLVALAVQLPTFLAPMMAFFAMQTIVVASWRNLPRRLFILACAAFLLVPIGGFLMQQPWFFVPAFFATITATLYFLPLLRHPIEGSSILFLVAVVVYQEIFEPLSIAVSTRDAAFEVAIGLVTATVVSSAFRVVGARAHLAAALAGAFARNRRRFADSIQRYRAPAYAVMPVDPPAYSTLSEHLQLLARVRQEGIAPDAERHFVALATAAERVESYVSTLDYDARQDVARAYRRLLDPEIAALAAAVEQALVAFAASAGSLRPGGDAPSLRPIEWPDFSALVDALEARQLALRQAGALAEVGAAESTNLNSLIRALVGIASVLHTPPDALGSMARGEPVEEAPRPRRAWPKPPPIDPYDLRYALHGGLGTTLCLLVGVSANLPQLGTILFNPVLVAQSSYGATVRRAWLRLLGVMVGALLGVAAIVAVIPNTNDVTIYVLLSFAVATACHYVSLGAPVSWYGSFQTAVTFFIVTYGLAPSDDVATALWRAWGTFLGTALLFAVYRVVAPDYAGRQLVARFGDLLRAARAYLPQPGAAVDPLPVQIERRIEVGKAVADLLRLADEARYESRQGIDPTAAVEATGLAMRVAYRAGLIARGRALAAVPRLSPATERLLRDVERTAVAWVDRLLDVLQARHTMARPGATAHDRACERAGAALSCDRPDLLGPVRALTAEIERTRFAELAAYPTDVTGELLAGIDHYRRLADLLPRLDVALAQTLLPGHGDAEARDGDPQPPERGHGLAA